jgi:integrase
MGRPRLDAPRYAIRRNRNGYFEVRWTEAGSTRSVSTGQTDEAGAREWLTVWSAGRDKGTHSDNPTVAELMERCRDERLKDGVRSAHTLKNSCNQVVKILGPLRPAQISQETIRKYAAERRVAGRSAGTIIRELVTLRAAMAMARKEKWTTETVEFKMPVRQPPPRTRWLSRDEAEALLSACTTPHVRLFVLIAINTGARRAAISDLEWSGVDLNAGQIDFGAGHGNKRRAVVPIRGRVLDELRAAKEVATTARVLEWGGRPAGNIKIAFAKACARAGLGDVTPHVLRHTAATWLVMAGVPTERIARMIGTTKEMIDRVYGKHDPAYLEDAAEVLSAGISGYSKKNAARKK